MELSQTTCRAELDEHNLIPRKYYGQVFTTDEKVIEKLIDTIKSIYKPGMKVVEIGGGLGYITNRLIEEFDDVDCVEFDEDLYEILVRKFHDFHSNQVEDVNKKFVHNQKLAVSEGESDNMNKLFTQPLHSEAKSSNSPKTPLNTKITQTPRLRLVLGDILEYEPSKGKNGNSHQKYLLVGNIPFHISGKLYRKFMSDIDHKPEGMIFITDKQYANTLMGQPPRCYRVSLQAQAYGDIEIVADVPPTSVYPEPKVTSCIMKITKNATVLPKNFWKVVNHHFENFPTLEVESPKMVGLKGWIELCKANDH